MSRLFINNYYYLDNPKIEWKNLFTTDLLLYSWNHLINNQNVRLFNITKIYIPISRKWFLKVAYLIRYGKFMYKKILDIKKRSTKYNQKIFLNLKYKVIENAFLIILSPFFNRTFISFLKCVNVLKVIKITFIEKLFYVNS